MNWLFAALAGIGFVEILMRVQFFATLGRFQHILARVPAILRSERISDHWKEKVLPRYALMMLRTTGRVAVSLLAAFAPFALLAGLAHLMGVAFLDFSMSWAGLIFITVVALAYAKLRPVGGSSDYGAGAQLLHRLALGSRAVAEVSMDIDQKLYPVDRDRVAQEPHVFVAGLARAGTTILMRQLHATGAFRSLTYRDMPFVLAPNLWARLSGGARQQMAAQERAHGDGILVDFDSPEALEEVFWRVQCGESYIHADRLTPMQVPSDIRAAFQGYVASILRAAEGKRYLSKNNNNILRLPEIAAAFPQAVLLIPFRDPLTHARSLMRQHRDFLARDAEDHFARQYMTWLAHHEFGADHRPFVFTEAPPEGDPASDLDYWLRLWRATYEALLRTAPDAAVFVCYETLCDDTETVWPKLCARLDLPEAAPAETLRRPDRPAAEPDETELLQACRALYGDLRARAI
ncbi:sulfotransferase [uncultured Roseobacter sp.]|uniref:sulfotransferase n=1 Tax=uncultured Roseobacter sp. TaxID=114847 RepID=UPI002626C76C|nr:sulfotransferase [uncultured Roseobacter sp.]